MDLAELGLNEEQLAKVTEYVDTQTSGLKSKNDELLGEKKTAQQSVQEKETALEEARRLAAETKEQNLKLSGDMDGLKKHYEQQLADSTAKANESAKKAQEALLARDKGTALSKALSLIHDDYKDFVTDKLSNMLNISYNDQGEAITEFKSEGKVIATDVDGFKSWAIEQPAFKKILNGVDSSGADTRQSQSSSAAQTVKRAQFDAMDHNARSTFFQAGGKVID